MDHPKRVLILMTVCWALSVVLPSNATIDFEPSVTTTVELAAGDQSVGKTIGLVAGSLFQAAPAAAQNGNGNGGGGATGCGWCEDYHIQGGEDHGWRHKFHANDPDDCEGEKPEPMNPAAMVQCAVCGLPGDCPDDDWEPGQCNSCGGGNGNGNGAGNGNGGGSGDLAALSPNTLAGALTRGDVATLAAAIKDSAPVVRVEYVVAGGRIELFGSCDPVRPIASLPVALDLREALALALAEE